MDMKDKILNFLDSHQIQYDLIEHPPAETCELSANHRGKDMAIGGKSILFKDKKDFRLFTLPADKKVDNNKVRKILKSQKLRFASNEELMHLAGVVKGALPPFGVPLIPYDHYVDNKLKDNTEIAFNAGVLTLSVVMDMQDYIRLVNPTWCDFAI
jgi:Ala-tRNA(Pro) deacylase